MKLHLDALQKIIELPTSDPVEIRHLLDDTIGDVKDMEVAPGGAAVFTVETLANRGDHLYLLGIARELSARLLTPLKVPSLATDLTDRKVAIPVRKNTTKCLRYALMEMSLPRGMKVRQDIAALLGDTGDKPAIVNLLNYIQMELGQPMHAFDRDKVDGEVLIELSEGESEIVALDGKTYKVPPHSLLIKDRKKILAVAGVIGCENSMCTADTTKVLIESATFDPICVRKTARAMGLSTDASFAFERGTDPETVLAGLRRLVVLAAGGAGAVTDSQSAHAIGLTYIEGDALEKRTITLKVGTVRKQLNSPRMEEIEVTTRLKHLGYMVASGEKLELKVTVPSWRLWDIKNEEDLIEDFARAHGLNKIKLALPPLDYEVPEPDPNELLLAAIEPALHGGGFYEVITRSFYSLEEVKILESVDPSVAERHVSLKNSLEKGISHLKVNNVLHLARLAEQSHRKGVLSFKVYELGRIFAKKGAEGGLYEHERDVLSLALSGRWHDGEFQKPEGLVEGLRHMKGQLEAIFQALGAEMNVAESKDPYFHPGYRATVKCGRTTYGSFGLLHPGLREALDLKQDLLYAELDAAQLARTLREREFREPIDFPSVRRDLTLKLGERQLSAAVVRSVFDSKAPNLTDIAVVDHFKKAEESFRRVTYRLTFQSPERTLEHAEVDAALQEILNGLKERHQIELA